MLRGNLASRPFYNERLASLLLLVLALVVAGLTAYNAVELWALTAERSRLVAETATNRKEAARIRREADAAVQGADDARLEMLAADSQEANRYLGRRAFSWTNFFGFIERTLPRDVRLVSVTPDPNAEETFQVVMQLVAEDPEALDTFVERLLATGRFYDMLPPSLQRNDDGTYGVVLPATYLPAIESAPAGDATAAEAP